MEGAAMIGKTFNDQELQKDKKNWPFQIVEEPRSHRPKTVR